MLGGSGGGVLASRRDSHTGTKELVYVDKTHGASIVPLCPSWLHLCAERLDLWLEEGATGTEQRVVRSASLACPQRSRAVTLLDVYAGTSGVKHTAEKVVKPRAINAFSDTTPTSETKTTEATADKTRSDAGETTRVRQTHPWVIVSVSVCIFDLYVYRRSDSKYNQYTPSGCS